MAFSRYEERSVFRNSRQLYRELFDERGVNFIRHYVTPEFRYPTPEEFTELDITYRSWRVGDRFWKIAEKNYGRPELWWVIAWFNKKPTEANVQIGEQILIPKPIERTLSMLGL